MMMMMCGKLIILFEEFYLLCDVYIHFNRRIGISLNSSLSLSTESCLEYLWLMCFLPLRIVLIFERFDKADLRCIKRGLLAFVKLDRFHRLLLSGRYTRNVGQL